MCGTNMCDSTVTLPPPRKVAIVHYWLVGMRGGEKVLESLCRMYPEATIFTHVCHKEALSPFLQERRIHTTFIQHLPFATRYYQKYLPLMPLALEQLDLTDYDLVLSSESGPAKGVLTRASCTHVCYCHSPMRYLWDFYPQYLATASWPVRLAMRPLFSRLRLWDVLSAHRVDHFVANSRTVAKRVYKHWRREAAIVYPPVDIAKFSLSTKRQDFYLCVGQLVDYKRVDIAIEACNILRKKLVIVGEGSARKKWEALAGSTVSFVGRKSDAEMADLYGSCAALLFPGEEDFGIVPVEAMLTGAPVIAYGQGGATESILCGETGLFFEEQSAASLCQAITSFEQSRQGFDPMHIREHALQFDEAHFMRGMRREIAHACGVMKKVSEFRNTSETADR